MEALSRQVRETCAGDGTLRLGSQRRNTGSWHGDVAFQCLTVNKDLNFVEKSHREIENRRQAASQVEPQPKQKAKMRSSWAK